MFILVTLRRFTLDTEGFLLLYEETRTTTKLWTLYTEELLEGLYLIFT